MGAYANNSLMKGLTPHLNALAEREGAVAVKKACCISAICTPSRLSVLTGRYLSAIYDEKESVWEWEVQILWRASSSLVGPRRTRSRR